MAATQPRRRHGKNTTTELPFDVLFNNILPRLPARSLVKYLSVSKQWYSFLKSPIYANMYLNYVMNDDRQNHHELLVLHKLKGKYSFSNWDCETHEPGMPRRRRPLPFEVISSIYVGMKSSCNGLVLVALMEKESSNTDLILWNPMTGDYKTLSKTDSKIDCYNTKFELYYNSSEEDYRLLLLTRQTDVYIYSLKSDSWRRINSEDDFQSFVWSPSACWFENLYFTDYGNHFVIRFDTKTEKFTKITTPFQQYRSCSRLTVQRGCIHMCAQKYDEPRIELWKMNRNEAWEKVSTYAQVLDSDLFLEPLHLMKDGNWLMTLEKNWSLKKIYKVDLENKHNKDSLFSYNLKGFAEVVYIETLVSPNQYMN